MAKSHVDDDEAPRPRRAPARTPDAREQQVIADAIDLAHRQILEGTVSSQVHTHFLKLGSSSERLEQAKRIQEIGLMKVRAEVLEADKASTEMFEKAISAMKIYQGGSPDLEMVDDGEY